MKFEHKPMVVLRLACIIVLTLAFSCVLFGCSEKNKGWDPNSGQTLYDYNLAHKSIALNSYNYDSLEEFEGRYYYMDGKEVVSKLGIDVSDHQGEINWSKVKANGIDFAFVRVGYRGNSEGLIKEDAMYLENLHGAKNAGLDVGVYFYSQALNADEGKEEADFVLSQLGGAKLDLPVVFDWEFAESSSARTNDAKSDQVTEAAVAFCEAVASEGYSPMIYLNKTAAEKAIDLSKLQEYSFWYAEYGKTPSLGFNFEIWQYKEAGKVFGVEGDADMNIMFEAKTKKE